MRKPKRPTPEVRHWLTPLNLAAKNLHVNGFHPDDLIRLCGALALVGSPVEHPDVFYAIQGLFFEASRGARWSEAIRALGANPTRIQRVADCVMAFQERSNKPFVKNRFNLVQVIQVMVQIPNPGPYLDLVMKQGFEQPGQIFHPNTFESAKRDLRGAIGSLAREGVSDSIASRIDTIEA